MSEMLDPPAARSLSPTRGVSRQPETSPDVLTPGDVRALLAACPDTPYGLRDRALLAVAYAAALRTRDVVTLELEDVDVDAGTVSVRRAGRRVALPLDEIAAAALERWVRKRRALGIGHDAPLFCTFRRRPGAIHPNNLRHNITEGLPERAGIDKPVSADALRRARAFELAWSGVPMHELQALFGQRDIKDTREYIARVAPGSPALEWTPAHLPAAERLSNQRPLQSRRNALAELADQRRGKKPPNAGRRFPPEVLTEREVLALLEACNNGPSGARDRALIAMLWRAGLRIAEALALYPKDIDGERGTVTVLHGKGDKWRIIGIDPQAFDVLELWLQARSELGIGRRSPLFCCIQGTQRGGAMRTQLVRSMLRRRAARAGIEKPVRPHGLRHTHAFELANEGTPTHLIKSQLGHTSLAVTERYIDHLAPTAVIRHMQTRRWGTAKSTPRLRVARDDG